MNNQIVQKTLEFWSSNIKKAEYVSGGQTHKVELLKNEVNKESNQLIIDFLINDDIEQDTTVTEVRWLDQDDNIWDSSEENIVRESYVEGIIYRYILTLRKEV